MALAKREIVKKSLPDMIADDLRERILHGELEEGEQIRQEALAEEYDVSRIPIREAISRLEAEGLVQLNEHRRACIAKHSIEEIHEIFDLRVLIEVDLLRRSIPKMNDNIIRQCEQLLDAMEDSFDAKDTHEWGSLNYQFHSMLYSTANRNLSIDILQRIGLLSDRYVRMHLSVMSQLEAAKEEHRQILDFVKQQKTDEACTLLAYHITRTRDQISDLINQSRAQKKIKLSK